MKHTKVWTKASEVRRLAGRAIDELIAAVEAGHSDSLKAYLAMQARLYEYSCGNVLRILIQRPSATRVAGYCAWQRLGRHVRRGAKAIRIVAPVTVRKRGDDKGDEPATAAFKAACVFDVSQTEGFPVPQFARVGGEPGGHLDRLKGFIADRGIALRYSTATGSADGMSAGGRIVVKTGLALATEFSVLAHELAHELLHHGKEARTQSKKVLETEAEAVAFVVCEAIGLDTNSAASDYIQLYQGDKETLVASLERIQRTAATIIRGVASGAVPEGPAAMPLLCHEKRPAA